jgi:hypothetical protein
MKVTIFCINPLDRYLPILKKYDFVPTEYFSESRRGIEKPIKQGVFEIDTLEHLEALTEEFQNFYKQLNIGSDTIFVIGYTDDKLSLQIYDGFIE